MVQGRQARIANYRYAFVRLVFHFSRNLLPRVTPEQVESFFLGLLRMAMCCRGRRPLILISNYLLATLVEVDIEEDHLLDSRHVKHAL